MSRYVDLFATTLFWNKGQAGKQNQFYCFKNLTFTMKSVLLTENSHILGPSF